MPALAVFKQLPYIAVGVTSIALGMNNAVRAATLTFDELPFQPVNGLSTQGVTFGFTIDGIGSTDANYGAGGPGPVTYLQDPSLEGNAAGILTLEFGNPTSLLQFGVALDTLSAITPGFSVSLFDAALNPVGTTAINTTPLTVFSEGLFDYSGTPVSRAVVDFDQTVAPRFAVDNLNFATRSEGVPEPTTIGGVALALGGLLRGRSWLKRRQQQKSVA